MVKKIVGVFFLFVLLFVLLELRLYTVSNDKTLAAAAKEQSSLKVHLSTQRGTIYDCNMNPLINNTVRYRTVVWFGADGLPKSTYEWLRSAIPEEQLLLKCADKKPFVVESEVKTDLPNTISVPIVVRYNQNQLASHIIGYVDAAGNTGLMGIEKAFDLLLNSGKKTIDVTFQQNGLGQILDSVAPDLTVEASGPEQGVVLTIDKTIQNYAVEAARKHLDKGAVVVAEVATGQIKACVSVPDFDPNDVEASFESGDAPFVNRAFSSYNVGSVFKLAVCAAALESGLTPDYSYNCTGKIDVDGQVFRCNNLNGHGVLSMKAAIAQSCNTYFINLGLKTGYPSVYAMAKAMGIGCLQIFADDYSTGAGFLPEPSKLAFKADAANIYFGQGQLLATPVQIAQMIVCIADGGAMRPLQLIKGTRSADGSLEENGSASSGVRVMSEETARIIRECMIEVVANGSGTRAQLENVGAGGKTSSAQTGKFREDGSEIVHAWFGGFFPAQDPQYVIVVVAEGGLYGGKAAAPVFREIALNILNGTQ